MDNKLHRKASIQDHALRTRNNPFWGQKILLRSLKRNFSWLPQSYKPYFLVVRQSGNYFLPDAVKSGVTEKNGLKPPPSTL